MTISKITVGYTRMSDARLQEHAQAIIAAMQDNKNFSDAQPMLTAVNDALNAFTEALSQAKTRDRVRVAFKNEVRAKLAAALRTLANFCTFKADGERSLLASSGFPLTSEQRTTQPLALPENFSVRLGNNSGEVMLSVNKVPGALAYIFQYAPAPVSQTPWLYSSSALPSITLSGLEPLTQYSFKVTVIGRRGQTTSTDIITKAVV